jgi:hypothetical protein
MFEQTNITVGALCHRDGPGIWVSFRRPLLLHKQCILLFPYVITRQSMYLQRNIEARSHYHKFCEKAIIITYSECVSVSLGVQHTLRMRRVL